MTDDTDIITVRPGLGGNVRCILPAIGTLTLSAAEAAALRDGLVAVTGGTLVRFGEGTDDDTISTVFGHLIAGRYVVGLSWADGQVDDPARLVDIGWNGDTVVSFDILDEDDCEVVVREAQRPFAELIGIEVY